MKKMIPLLAASMLAVSAVSCGGKKTGKASDTAPANTSEASQSETDLTTTTATTTSVTASTTVTTTSKPQPTGEDAFEYNTDGAVVFEADTETADDSTLMAAAQAIFDSACRTQMDFTVGCPFEVDLNDYISNDFDWHFYRITDSSISSYSDVENAYHKVFSDRYDNQLSSLYIEKNGAVYALCGNRGSNIYYSWSKVTGIKSRSDDEIVFTVDNHYTGSDYGEGAHTETDDFSVVIGKDNVWKAGQFLLPY